MKLRGSKQPPANSMLPGHRAGPGCVSRAPEFSGTRVWALGCVSGSQSARGSAGYQVGPPSPKVEKRGSDTAVICLRCQAGLP